jgi:hypothetical protein
MSILDAPRRDLAAACALDIAGMLPVRSQSDSRAIQKRGLRRRCGVLFPRALVKAGLRYLDMAGHTDMRVSLQRFTK